MRSSHPRSPIDHPSNGSKSQIFGQLWSLFLFFSTCTKDFPKEFNSETIVDEEGFPVYKRSDDGRHIKKGKIEVDNTDVVPYNRDLLVEFQSHINVEWCNMSRSVKYLFKYIHKGVDYVCGILKEKGLKDDQVDEIKKYLEMRYISTIEACWRLFQFDIHYQDPQWKD
jgi:hypothetical protein